MEWNSIIIALISTGLGAGLGVLLKYRIDAGRLTQEAFTKLYERLEADNNRLRERELANAEQIDLLRQRLDDLTRKLRVLESAHLDLPIPQWMKDITGAIISVNEQCEKVFLKPFKLNAIESIGKTDFEIFPEATARLIQKNDAQVIKRKKPLHSIEELEVGDDIVKWHVLRYPILADKTVIAVGGIAFKQVYEGVDEQ